jgi:hypothetical protein
LGNAYLLCIFMSWTKLRIVIARFLTGCRLKH